jgi:hypothetical protein
MSEQILRAKLAGLLESSHAHVPFEQAVAAMPVALTGDRPRGLPHSAWEQLEHLRLAQEDILGFSRGGDHESAEWPAGYWPAAPEPPTEDAWQHSVDAFLADRAAMQSLALDDSRDLFEPFAWGDGQNLVRELLLLADHNAYHIGQLVQVRRALGCWPPGG